MQKNMVTVTKIHNLEKRLALSGKGKGELIIRYASIDGQLVNKDGYLLTKMEIKQMEKENKILRELGKTVIYKLQSYGPAMARPGGVSAPYKPLLRPSGKSPWKSLE